MLRRAAEEEATLVGTLLVWGEHGQAVAVRTATGQVHRGRVGAVGRDVVVVERDDRRHCLVSLSAIASVRARAPEHDTSGSQEAPLGVSMRSLLTELAIERPRVQVGALGFEGPVAGMLRSAGADVATVVLDGGAERMIIALDRIAEVVLLDL